MRLGTGCGVPVVGGEEPLDERLLHVCVLIPVFHGLLPSPAGGCVLRLRS